MKVGDTIRVIRSGLQHSGKTAKVIDCMEGSRWVKVEFSGDQRVWPEPKYSMSYLIDEVEVIESESEPHIVLVELNGVVNTITYPTLDEAKAPYDLLKKMLAGSATITLAKVVVS